MASSSLKKTAQSNINILNQLRYTTPLALVCLIIIYFFKRPSNYWIFIIFQLPIIGCQLFLEKIGQPKYKVDPIDGYKKLIGSGENLNQTGLTEYIFDIIYFNLILDVLLVIFGSNKIWYLWLIIPIYVIYKLSGFILPFIKPYFTKQPKSESSSAPKEEKSKRQQKMEKRKTVRVR